MADTVETTPPTQAQKLAAEAIGTFVLVLVGCGSIAWLQAPSGSGGLEIALAFGLVLVGLGFVFARISGGHFNPVVSIGAALAGRMAWVEAALYAAAQLVGAIVGGAVLLLLFKGYEGFDAFTNPLGASTWGDTGSGYKWWTAIILELLLCAIFVIAFLGATDTRNASAALAPLVTGLTFAALYAISVPAVGGGVNPARSIGANLFSGGDALKGTWVFIIGPVIGAAIGGLAYPALFGRDADPVPGSGLNLSSGTAAPGYGQQWAPPQGGGYAAPQAGGYGAPQTGAYPQAGAAPAPTPQQAQPVPQPVAEQPIIQDGWQWDPQAQQWFPAAQQQNPAPGWGTPAPGGGEQTQIRGTD